MLYNIVMVFAIHQHESAMGADMSPHPKPLSYQPPRPIPLGCPRAPALSALLHAVNHDILFHDSVSNSGLGVWS